MQYNYAHFFFVAGGVDYRELNAEALDVVLTFDDRNRRQSFMLDIFNDEQFESAEQFDVELRFNPLPDSSPPTSVEVLLHPNVTTVYILDDSNSTLLCFVIIA